MSEKLAQVRKAVVTAVGAGLLVAVQVLPLVHGRAADVLAAFIAVATVVATHRVENAPASPAP